MKKLLFLLICAVLVLVLILVLASAILTGGPAADTDGPTAGIQSPAAEADSTPEQSDSRIQEILEGFGLDEETAASLSEKVEELSPGELAGKIRMALDISQSLTDEQLGQVIRSGVSQRGISLTDGQIRQLVKLCRQMEKLDDAQLEEKLQEIKDALSSLAEAKETAGNVTEKAKDAVQNAGETLSELIDKIKQAA